MVNPEQAQWVLDKIVVPGLVGLGGALLGARRARRTIHVSRLTEAEARAYEETLADFKALRRHAAYQVRQQELSDRSVGWVPEDETRTRELQEAGVHALDRLRDTEAVGAVELSEGAVRVIRELLAAWDDDSPDRSSGQGIVYEYDSITSQYLRYFKERRLVDLGEMWEVTWWIRRGRRALWRQVLKPWWAFRNWRAMRESDRTIRDRVAESLGTDVPIPSVRAAYELVGLTIEQRQQAWRTTVERHGRKPTAEQTKQVVLEVRQPLRPVRRAVNPPVPPPTVPPKQP
jgi:hypothetical protein